jgi:hypothetical protein
MRTPKFAAFFGESVALILRPAFGLLARPYPLYGFQRALREIIIAL